MEAIDYIQSLELTPPERRGPGQPAPPPPEFTGDGQALTIGAGMTEFYKHVPQMLRPALSDSLLLAQLAADKATAAQNDPWAWFSNYDSVFRKIGWICNSTEAAAQNFSDTNVELHQAIIPLLTAAFGPAVAATSLIITALTQLQTMNKESPWITLFHQKSASVNAAKFGTSHVGLGADGEAEIKSVFFGVEARQRITQVLFLKLSSGSAKVKSATSNARLSGDMISRIELTLKDKVAPYITDNIKNIDI
jgi:hypothetical protein